MGFVVNTNIGAMSAHRNASVNNMGLDKSLSSLSSGLSINKAADDASGLAIANKLSAQSRGLGQAISNSNDMIGLVQTADGAIEELTHILKRIRVLAVQSANDTQDDTSRGHIQKEVDELKSSYTQIVGSTLFNDKPILGTTDKSFVAHVGHKTGDNFTFTINAIGTGFVLDVSTQAGASSVITTMDSYIKDSDTNRAILGSTQNKLESNIRNISVTQVNTASAESQLRDVDFAAESAIFAKHNILAQSGSYAMSQANSAQQHVLRLLQ